MVESLVDLVRQNRTIDQRMRDYLERQDRLEKSIRKMYQKIWEGNCLDLQYEEGEVIARRLRQLLGGPPA